MAELEMRYLKTSNLYPKNLDDLRKVEFCHLKGSTYLDHAGSTLYGNRQISGFMSDLGRNLYGNPHSVNPSSDMMADVIYQIRCTVLSHFNTSLEDYELIFTSGATDALKTISSSFCWSPGQSKFVYLEDNHTSIVGIREVAAQKKSLSFCLSPLKKNSDNHEFLPFSLTSYDATPIKQNSSTVDLLHKQKFYSLFAYPAQSNFSGCKYPLEWIDEVKSNGFPSTLSAMADSSDEDWSVLLDAASFVATSAFDLQKHKPDFVCMSFYKMFGFPTGLGALLVKRDSSKKLGAKTYFGGGTADGYLTREDFFKPRASLQNRLEDGTLPFLDILSLKYGFDFLYNVIGRSMNPVRHHTFALAQRMYEEMKELRHGNDRPVVEVYSYSQFTDCVRQGPIVAFNVKRLDGSYVGFNHVLHLASSRNIHMRGGCFCNVGACTIMLHLAPETLRKSFESGHSCGGSSDLREDGQPLGAVRASLGYMSTDDDVIALVDFLRDCFVCKRETIVDPLDLHPETPSASIYLKAIFVYPVKSCRPIKVWKWKVCETGLQYDRTWMIVNEHGVCLTLKREPKLALIQPAIDLAAETLSLTADGFGSVTIPIKPVVSSTAATVDVCQAKVCSDRVVGLDCGDEASTWLTALLGKPASLLRCSSDTLRVSRRSRQDDGDQLSPISLVNEAQYLLLSLSSVEQLRDALKENSAPSDIDTEELFRRLRCNFVVAGAKPFAEETWAELLMEGEHGQDALRFRCTGLCNRCNMICVHSRTGKRTVEPLKTLASFPLSLCEGKPVRRNHFGVYLSSCFNDQFVFTGSKIVST